MLGEKIFGGVRKRERVSSILGRTPVVKLPFDRGKLRNGVGVFRLGRARSLHHDSVRDLLIVFDGFVREQDWLAPVFSEVFATLKEGCID
jgi:hypothetical protein